MLARTGLSPAAAALPRAFRFACFADVEVLQPRTPRKASGLGSSPFARRYLGNHCYFLLLRVLRCFSSPRVPPLRGWHMLPYAGLPHSEIPGSKVICTSPGLIAAYHVLHRRQEPGHPLCALSNLLDFTRFTSFSLALEIYSQSSVISLSSSSLSKNFGSLRSLCGG